MLIKDYWYNVVGNPVHDPQMLIRAKLSFGWNWSLSRKAPGKPGNGHFRRNLQAMKKNKEKKISKCFIK